MEQPDRLGPSIDNALRFIEGGVSAQGFWSDFLTLAGESSYWVSGYVGHALALSLTGRDQGKKRSRLLVQVGSRILERQYPNGGWGYGPGVPADADSTSWCLLFLFSIGALSPNTLDKAVRFLSEHQSPLDGGFRTYAVPREIARFMFLDEGVSFEGWSSSQTCVTAAATQALVKTGSRIGFERGLEFIRGAQASEGYWNAYWWNETLYSTVLCMAALAARGPVRDGEAGDVALLDKAKAWIARTQLASGGWNAEGWPFSTALGVTGLMLGSKPEEAVSSPPVRRGVEWLLTHQLADGSWEGSHILRIPHPSAKVPWTQSNWTVDGKAINAAIKDHRRLYTTATAVSALSEYERGLSGETDAGGLGDV